MKMFPCALLMTAALATATAFAPLLAPADACAKVAEYGASGARFTVDVPEGWKARKMSDGVQIDAPDHSAMLVVLLVPLGQGAPDAQTMAKNYKESRPGATMESDGFTWTVRDAGQEGRQTVLTCANLGGLLLLKNITGKDLAAAEAIAATVTAR